MKVNFVTRSLLLLDFGNKLKGPRSQTFSNLLSPLPLYENIYFKVDNTVGAVGVRCVQEGKSVRILCQLQNLPKHQCDCARRY